MARPLPIPAMNAIGIESVAIDFRRPCHGWLYFVGSSSSSIQPKPLKIAVHCRSFSALSAASRFASYPMSAASRTERSGW